MDAITALQTRTAAPRLVEPAPGPVEMEQIIKAALRAPDHGMLRPWRYLIVQGDARQKLGQLFVDCLQPEAPEVRERLLNSALRAPMVIIAVAAIKQHPKVPAIEQVSSTAAGVQNMQVAIHALGFDANWRTGEVAYDARIKAALGLQPSDEIVGYLYVGTATTKDRPVPEHAQENFVEYWK